MKLFGAVSMKSSDLSATFLNVLTKNGIAVAIHMSPPSSFRKDPGRILGDYILCFLQKSLMALFPLREGS